MQDGDGILCFNFRADRVREILAALLDPDFDGFARARAPIRFAAVAGHDPLLRRADAVLGACSRPRRLDNILGEVVARRRPEPSCASPRPRNTPHVTYFFNGGEETPIPGEDRIMVPSPKVATYDLQPEMSAPELTDKAVEAIDSRQIRPDRAELRQRRHGRPHRHPAGRDQGGGDGGHLPRPASLAAIDGQGGALLITADHGNCELMRDPETGGPHRPHHQPGAGGAGRRPRRSRCTTAGSPTSRRRCWR